MIGLLACFLGFSFVASGTKRLSSEPPAQFRGSTNNVKSSSEIHRLCIG